MSRPIARPVAAATVVAGTLDIAFAMILTLAYGRAIPDMLRYVASGPVPAATQMGETGALLGLLVHYALMAIMAAVFMAVAVRRPALLARPVLAGIGYGLVTYVIMNWLVVPIRFDRPLPPSLIATATQLFAHVGLVGIPFALIAARYRARRSAQ